VHMKSSSVEYTQWHDSPSLAQRKNTREKDSYKVAAS
jgi:hypothetical protein